MNEKLIWKGSPSQWTNFPFYCLCTLLAIVGVGIFMAIWKYVKTKCNKFEVTDQRILLHQGVFSKTVDELELYRVKDLRLHQPFWLRVVGLSSISLDTTDHSDPEVWINGISNGVELKEQLRVAIDIRRDIKGVREIDYN